MTTHDNRKPQKEAQLSLG